MERKEFQGGLISSQSVLSRAPPNLAVRAVALALFNDKTISASLLVTPPGPK